MKTIENNGVILIDPYMEKEVVVGLLLEMNAFASIKTAEIATTINKATQYRMRKEGRFPKLHYVTGRRKAYRVRELKDWLQNPKNYSS